MIAILIFSLFSQISAEADCDGEVTACGTCTSSSETFAQCQWCSSNGHCNGKFDLGVDCPNGGQWLFDCSATTGVQASSAPVVTPTPQQGTCQTASFCKTTCGISGSITQNSVSWGYCCADCTSVSAIHSINGYCSNGCLAGGRPPATPSATLSTELSGRTNRDNCIACRGGQLQWKTVDQPVWCMSQGDNCANSQQNDRFCYDLRCPDNTVQVSDCNTESSSQLTFTGNLNPCVQATKLATQNYNTASKSTISIFIAVTALWAL